MTRDNRRSVGISRFLWREQHRLSRANAVLRRENSRLRAEVAELENIINALRVERDAADALLGAAIDGLLGGWGRPGRRS